MWVYHENIIALNYSDQINDYYDEQADYYSYENDYYNNQTYWQNDSWVNCTLKEDYNSDRLSSSEIAEWLMSLNNLNNIDINHVTILVVIYCCCHCNELFESNNDLHQHVQSTHSCKLINLTATALLSISD